MKIIKGTKISFKSAYRKANGAWMVFNILFMDGEQTLSFARIGKKGQLLGINAKNLMSIEAKVVDAAIADGTASII